jgi:hypothetical protein
MLRTVLPFELCKRISRNGLDRVFAGGVEGEELRRLNIRSRRNSGYVPPALQILEPVSERD